MKNLYRLFARVFASLLTLLALMLLAGCSGILNCPQAGFGSSQACSTGGSGNLGGGGGTGGTGGGGGGTGLTAYVYAIDQNGTIDGYELSQSANTFGPITGYTAPQIALNNGGVGMVVAQKQYLYAAIAASNFVYGYTIGTDGSLINDSPFTVTALSQYVNGVGEDNIIVNPQGTLMFISDAGQSQVWVYLIGAGGMLSEATSSPVSLPTGFIPMNLATDGLGKYLYVVNGVDTTHQGSLVAAYAIGSSGSLTAVTGSPFSFPMWQLQGEPTGQFMIGTSGSSLYKGVPDDLNLYSFGITQTGANAGALTQISKTTTVYSPFNIAVQSNTNQNLVYSFSFNDTGTGINPVEGYSISSTGTLEAITQSPFTNIGNGTWGQFDQSGQILMAYSSYINSNNETTTEITPLNVPTDGDLTEPLSPTFLATPGFWAVTDQP